MNRDTAILTKTKRNAAHRGALTAALRAGGAILCAAALFFVGCVENPADSQDPGEQPLAAVSDLSLSQSASGTITVAWSNPSASDFEQVYIAWIANEIGEGGSATVTKDDPINNSYDAADLTNDVSYIVTVTARYSGNKESAGETRTFTPRRFGFLANSYAVTLSENRAGSLLLGSVDTFSASPLAYTLAGDGADLFAVDASGDMYYVGDGENHEEAFGGVPERMLTLTISDGVALYQFSAALLITVTDGVGDYADTPTISGIVPAAGYSVGADGFTIYGVSNPGFAVIGTFIWSHEDDPAFSDTFTFTLMCSIAAVEVTTQSNNNNISIAVIVQDTNYTTQSCTVSNIMTTAGYTVPPITITIVKAAQ